MTERAQVVEVNGSSAKVVCSSNDACESCSSMFCAPQKRFFEATVTSDVTVRPGDQVEVSVPPSRAIGSGFLVLILPLILFVAVYLAFGFLDSESAQVGVGLAGLFGGFGIVYLVGGRRKKRLPQITRVFTGPELSPVTIHDTTV